jgi:hypothetical protein
MRARETAVVMNSDTITVTGIVTTKNAPIRTTNSPIKILEEGKATTPAATAYKERTLPITITAGLRRNENCCAPVL